MKRVLSLFNFGGFDVSSICPDTGRGPNAFGTNHFLLNHYVICDSSRSHLARGLEGGIPAFIRAARPP